MSTYRKPCHIRNCICNIEMSWIDKNIYNIDKQLIVHNLVLSTSSTRSWSGHHSWRTRRQTGSTTTAPYIAPTPTSCCSCYCSIYVFWGPSSRSIDTAARYWCWVLLLLLICAILLVLDIALLIIMYCKGVGGVYRFVWGMSLSVSVGHCAHTWLCICMYVI